MVKQQSDDDFDDASSEYEIMPLHPLFNWVGSKRRYCARLAELLPQDYDLDKHTYFEPFLGSGSFLLFLQPFKAIVGDLDKNVISTFSNVKTNHKLVINYLRKLYVGNVKENYVKVCKNFSKLPFIAQSAAFIFISKHSFGSNLIYNKEKTGFTLCWRNLVVKTDYQNITDVSEYLRTSNVVFKNSDFRDVTKNAKKNDFIFLDPPYVTVRKTQKQYYNDQTELDVDTLAKELIRLHKQGCLVLLINSDCKNLRDALHPYFKCKTFKANEKILGAHGKGYSNKRKECIYVNWS